jgi:hypothetical protein
MPKRGIVAFKRRPDCEYSDGVITALKHGFHFAVMLDDGREVVAVLPRSTLRRFGCLFGTLAGYRLTVVHRSDAKPPLIVDLNRPSESAMSKGN